MALLLWQLASILLGSEFFITIIVMIIIWRHCKFSKPSFKTTNNDKQVLHTIADDIILEDLFSFDAQVEIGVPPSNHGSFRLSTGKSKIINGLTPLPSVRESPKIRRSPAGRSPGISPEHHHEQRSISPLVLQEYPKSHHTMFIPFHSAKVSPKPFRGRYSAHDYSSDSSLSPVRDSSIDISLRSSPIPHIRPNVLGESSQNSPTQSEQRKSNFSSFRETLRLDSPMDNNQSHYESPFFFNRPTMGEENKLESNFEDYTVPDSRGPGRVRFEPLWSGKYVNILPDEDKDTSSSFTKEINK